jgi:heme-degrading monooxygenase HmoA
MICCSFVFEPGEHDDDFLKLDNAIDVYARSLPGFIKTEKWFSDDKLRINSMYYFEDEATMDRLAQLPAHIKAKSEADRWYLDYSVEIFEVLRKYGK